MPKAYWISAYRAIKDPNKLAAYAALGDGAEREIRIIEGV